MTPKELVKLWIEAFNAKDVERLASLYAPGATNHQVAESPITGRSEIRAMFEKGFAMAEMICIPENLFTDGEWAILEWRDPKGLRGCGFFHVLDNQIVFQRGYWDKLSFLRLHGLKSKFDVVAPDADLKKSLTPRCRRAVEFAGNTYPGLGSESVTSVHLLLGLRSLDGGVASNVPGLADITFEKAEDYIAQHTDYRETFRVSGPINVGQSASNAILRAEKEADDLQHTFVGTEHLLLAILEERVGPAAAFFGFFQIDRGEIARRIRNELGSEPLARP